MEINPTDYADTDDVGRAAIRALCRLARVASNDVSFIHISDTSVCYTVMIHDDKGRVTSRDVVKVQY